MFRMVRCSGRIVRSTFFLIMTREERIKAELAKLNEYRRQAILKNDLVWVLRNDSKIKEKEAELEECKRYHPTRLSEVLHEKDEATKDRVYKALLKISLAADFINDCAMEAKSIMKEIGLDDFTLRAETAELCKLSQRVASFVIVPNQDLLTDMICDNADFIETCHDAADKHLKNKLKL